MHIGVFDVLNKVLLQKLSGDVSKKHYFSAGFLVFFCICIQNPYFLVLAFLFVGFEFLCFFLFLLLLLFQKSSCYVVVSAFLLYWVSLVFFCGMCCFFLVCVWLLWLFFWRVKGSVEVAQSPPQKKHGSVLLVFVVVSCCFFFVVVAVVVLSFLSLSSFFSWFPCCFPVFVFLLACFLGFVVLVCWNNANIT